MTRRTVNLGHIDEHPEVLVGVRYEQRPAKRHGIVVHEDFSETYVSLSAAVKAVGEAVAETVDDGKNDLLDAILRRLKAFGGES